jgi:hypothetical protein
MPNGARLSRGRGRILGDMEPTPALWRSVSHTERRHPVGIWLAASPPGAGKASHQRPGGRDCSSGGPSGSRSTDRCPITDALDMPATRRSEARRVRCRLRTRPSGARWADPAPPMPRGTRDRGRCGADHQRRRTPGRLAPRARRAPPAEDAERSVRLSRWPSRVAATRPAYPRGRDPARPRPERSGRPCAGGGAYQEDSD